MLNGATHVGFVGVSYLDTAHRFYGETLGLVPEDVWPLGSFIRVQGFSSASPWSKRSVRRPRVLGLAVAGLEGELDQLAAAGRVLRRYVNMAQDDSGIWTSPSGARTAWFHDPDVNNISLSG